MWSHPDFNLNQVGINHTGPDRSCSAIRTFILSRLGISHVWPDKSFYYSIWAFNVDQLDVIYTEPDMSFYYAIRAFNVYYMLSILGRIGHLLHHPGF